MLGCSQPQEQQSNLKQAINIEHIDYENISEFTPLGPKPMKLMSPCPENLTLCTSWGPKRWKKCGYGSSEFT